MPDLFKVVIVFMLFIAGFIVSSFIWRPTGFTQEKVFLINQPSVGDLLEVLKRTGIKIKQLVNSTARKCVLKRFGQPENQTQTNWAAHALCNIPPGSPCIFYSFGTSHDYNFDLDVANRWHCQGIAFDPTVEHRSRLHPNVTFHMIGARTLSDQEDSRWPLVASVTALRQCFKHKKLNILKMDCEGCEFSLARDVEHEMPNFFATIDQVALEVHVSQFWMTTANHTFNLAKLFRYLEQSSLELVDAELVPCAFEHERYGCSSLLLNNDYPCATNKMCQNLLFARL